MGSRAARAGGRCMTSSIRRRSVCHVRLSSSRCTRAVMAAARWG